MLANTIFATTQLLLALGIAFRPTARLALAASIAWAAGVWWFGEGLGGVLTGNASPVGGTPGAVIIYALLAVLLWPADRAGEPAPFTAARAIGTRPAQALWLVLAVALALAAAGVYLPWPAVKAPLVLAIVVAMAIWVFGEALGAIFTGSGTDPNSGPLLVLLALAYWPVTTVTVAHRGRHRHRHRPAAGSHRCTA